MTGETRGELVAVAAEAIKAHDPERMSCLSDHKTCCPSGHHDFDSGYDHLAEAVLDAVADRLRAEAWDEGYAEGQDHEIEVNDHVNTYDTPWTGHPPTNPYRTDQHVG